MNITIKRGDDLQWKEWCFTFSCEMYRQAGLCLGAYKELSRPTKRHKATGSIWSALSQRRGTDHPRRPTSIPPDVLQEARDIAAKSIQTCPVYIGFTNPECRYEEMT